MHDIKSLIFLLIFLVANNLVAQDKYEKESRIKRVDVPSKAFSFIDSLNFKNKIKWFKEVGLTNISFEAKFEEHKKKYSVEFDELGNVQDVEIEVIWQDLDSQLTRSITKQLELDCSKHKIVKIQRQFTGTRIDLFSLIHKGTTSEKSQIKYEVVVRCKKQKEVHLYEYLFTEKGLLLSKSKIIFKDSSHLEY